MPAWPSLNAACPPAHAILSRKIFKLWQPLLYFHKAFQQQKGLVRSAFLQHLAGRNA